MTRAKIQATHLQRSAYVYVRQSTQHQVQHHTESTQRQYELKLRAQDLGWTSERIVVIDDDLGKSASGQSERSGFERLVSDVALGRAGIVLGLEVSRLARNNRDWYHLLDLCAARATLIGDTDGIYDASAYNDRLLLGLKGTMSEAELHVLRGRMLEGLRHKAKKGELKYRLPAGYEYLDDEITKTSDDQVSHFVALVFSKALEKGSASGVARYLDVEGLLFPRRVPGGTSIAWVRPYYRAVHLMLTNPIYAGAYAYGRTEKAVAITGDGVIRTRRRNKPMARWDVMIHDHHPEYISWQTYERIQRMLEGNRPARPDEVSNVAREGAALLQGIVRCGRCGRSMMVKYPRAEKNARYYTCSAASAQRRAGHCQSMGGRRIDAMVVSVLLEAMSAASFEVHLEALKQLGEHEDGALRQLELQLTRARYQAQRMERQYATVEPENRLVARTLETRWNEALAQATELERQLECRKQELVKRLSPEEENQVRNLANDLPRLWQHPSLSNVDRKLLIRSVIEEVQLRKDDREVHTKILWKGGATTETSVTLPRLPPPQLAAPVELMALIGDLATRHTDTQIARVLVRRGVKTPKKKLPFTAQHVEGLRRTHGIARFAPDPESTTDIYTVEQAARLFSVSGPTIYAWLKLGILVGEQITAAAPWSIRITKTDRDRLSAPAPVGWVPVESAASELGVTKQTVLNWVKAKKVDFAYATRGRQRGLRIDVKSAPQRGQPRLLD